MHIILGASGHIGSALAKLLLAKHEPVTVVLRDPRKAPEWQQRGAQTALADVHDTEALRRIFRQGQRLFLLNPPADPATDAAAAERRSVQSILAALTDSGLEKIVAESTYGAQPGDQLGDLGVLYEMEQGLAAQPIPVSIIRGAYYLSNWDAAQETARQEGNVHTFYPIDFKLPMVAPADIARLAARLLTEPIEKTGLHYIEGPEYYSAADVAAAFAQALHQPVTAVETPRDQWLPAMQKMGLSEKTAQSFANMTAATLAARQPIAKSPEHGSTTLTAYIQALVQQG